MLIIKYLLLQSTIIPDNRKNVQGVNIATQQTYTGCIKQNNEQVHTNTIKATWKKVMRQPLSIKARSNLYILPVTLTDVFRDFLTLTTILVPDECTDDWGVHLTAVLQTGDFKAAKLRLMFLVETTVGWNILLEDCFLFALSDKLSKLKFMSLVERIDGLNGWCSGLP